MGAGRGDHLRLSLAHGLLQLAPTLRHAVVAGSPDDEGNSVEVVRGLAGLMPVYWLVNEHPESLLWLVDDVDGRANIRCVPRDSVRAYLAYLTARYIFFTHGLYGSPPPPAHKTVVNLWHGDGPKSRKGFAIIRSTFIVAGTSMWGLRRSQIFDVPAESVLITGNPRVDQFQRPPTREAMRTLALSDDRPLVLWLPTYRRTEYRGRRLGAVRNWSDADDLSRSEDPTEFAEQLARAAAERGIQVAIKPHPLDADRYEALPLPVIGQAELRQARTTPYQLLGITRGLITDYSSVWTDYLSLDRPIGFFCPDLDAYQAARGLNVEHYEEILPGPLLHSKDTVDAFLDECLEDSIAARARRRQVALTIGTGEAAGATDRLLAALGLTTAPQLSRRPRAGARPARSSRG